MLERTFVLIKPGAVARGLVGAVLARFETRGFRIRAMKYLQVTRELAEQHYEEHREKDFFGELVSSITSGPVAAFVLEGPEAIAVVRKMMGSTNPMAAEPGTIRGDFGLEIVANVVHGSDSPASAEREIKLYFSESEII
ncbi:MAG: nucleoside-diphosphate kinase [Actinomycetota bacterium]|jgi:nucleoside-diphosphate kinase|nr:nucleoside-diphosphate kinase [Actinomycetota bacterium]MCL6093062.1 nucleoside-diphosphate kinase [Actinomycetota bacterium]MDA8167391.1 nucleoside-diphosphate kinase [Actinomycetota bacterium]